MYCMYIPLRTVDGWLFSPSLSSLESNGDAGPDAVRGREDPGNIAAGFRARALCNAATFFEGALVVLDLEESSSKGEEVDNGS